MLENRSSQAYGHTFRKRDKSLYFSSCPRQAAAAMQSLRHMLLSLLLICSFFEKFPQRWPWNIDLLALSFFIKLASLWICIFPFHIKLHVCNMQKGSKCFVCN